MLLEVYRKVHPVTKAAYAYITVKTNYRAKSLASRNVNPKISFPADQWLETTHEYGPWIQNSTNPELALLQNQHIRKICEDLNTAALYVQKKIGKEPTASDVIKQYEKNVGITQRIKLVDFLHDFVAMKSLEGKSAENYTVKLAGIIRKYMDKYSTDLYLDELDTTFLYKMEMYLKKANSRNGRPYNEGTVRVYLEWMRGVVGMAENLGEIESDVKAKHRIVTKIKKKRAGIPDLDNVDYWPITPAQLNMIEMVTLSSHYNRGNYLDDSNRSLSVDLVRTRLLFLLQTWTGMAYADLCNTPDARLHIKKDYQGDKSFYYERQKGGELAMVKVFKPAEFLLQELGYDCRPSETYDEYLKKIKALMRFYAIELPEDWGKGGTHLGRHLFGLRMLHMGFSMDSVSRMMGHSTIKYTESVYARVDMTKINADYERILRANAFEDVNIAV